MTIRRRNLMEQARSKQASSGTAVDNVIITGHALRQMSRRRISAADVWTVLRYGRMKWVRGAIHFAVGRKEVAMHRACAPEVREAEGIHVVARSTDNFLFVLTLYRNHDFRCLRSSSRSKRRRG